MPTVLITISRGSIARNILQSAAFRILRERGLRVVILSPAWKDEEFRRTFGGENVGFEELLGVKWTVLDRLLVGIHKGLVYNAGTELRDRYGIYQRGEGGIIKWIAKRAAFKPLSGIGALKDLVRWVDLRFLSERRYAELFARERPVLVFSTNPMEDADVSVMKAARAAGVPILAMPKSWDNLPKISFRVKPDRLLVWGPALVEQARMHQNMEAEAVGVVGGPQFDIFDEPGTILPREEFFRKIGADPSRKLIVFGSEGKITPTDPEIAEIIARFIAEDRLGRLAQIYLRPYFALKGEEKKFDGFSGRKNVVVDRWFVPHEAFRDRWDYTREHAIHFANLMYHMDVMVCTASTLTLDAVFLDKPAVNIAFDGFQKKSYGDSVARWYDTAHFAPVAALGGSWIVRSEDDLHEALVGYLANPKLHAEGRARIREQYCPRLGRPSGEAIAGEVVAAIDCGPKA